jgi:hypothetical protein
LPQRARRLGGESHDAVGDLGLPSPADAHDRSPNKHGCLQLSRVEIAPHRVAVEACGLELAHDHPDVLLAEVLSPVTRDRDDDTGFVAEAPMACGLAAKFGKAVID